jgi:hypothetical protein
MTPIDTSAVAELPDIQAGRLRIIANWFAEQNLVEAAAHLMCAADLIEQQSARLQELEKDAARYRWLRTRINYLDGTGGVSTARSAPILTYRYRNWTHTSYAFEHDTIDAYIDAALAADAGKPL